MQVESWVVGRESGVVDGRESGMALALSSSLKQEYE